MAQPKPVPKPPPRELSWETAVEAADPGYKEVPKVLYQFGGNRKFHDRPLPDKEPHE